MTKETSTPPVQAAPKPAEKPQQGPVFTDWAAI